MAKKNVDEPMFEETTGSKEPMFVENTASEELIFEESASSNSADAEISTPEAAVFEETSTTETAVFEETSRKKAVPQQTSAKTSAEATATTPKKSRTTSTTKKQATTSRSRTSSSATTSTTASSSTQRQTSTSTSSSTQRQTSTSTSSSTHSQTSTSTRSGSSSSRGNKKSGLKSHFYLILVLELIVVLVTYLIAKGTWGTWLDTVGIGLFFSCMVPGFFMLVTVGSGSLSLKQKFKRFFLELMMLIITLCLVGWFGMKSVEAGREHAMQTKAMLNTEIIADHVKKVLDDSYVVNVDSAVALTVHTDSVVEERIYDYKITVKRDNNTFESVGFYIGYDEDYQIRHLLAYSHEGEELSAEFDAFMESVTSKESEIVSIFK